MSFIRDRRYAARSFSRTPGLTAALLFTVALGVGSYVTIAGFSNGLQQELSQWITTEGQFKLQRLRTLMSWTTWLVFLTAAANLAGLLLSRASRRGHETAARAALGATRGRLASLVVADSVVIALGGGLLGAIVASWTATSFSALLYSDDVDRLRMTGEAGLVVRAIAAYGATMLVCALGPISQLHQHGPMTVLRRSSDLSGTAGGRLRSTVVTVQIVTCVLLVIGSAVLLRGFQSAVRTVRAEEIGHPIVAILESDARFARPDLGRNYFDTAERLVAGSPGVTGTEWTSRLPGAKSHGLRFQLQPPPAGFGEAVIDTVTSNGAEVLTQRVKSGRLFGGVDAAGSCPVAIANLSAEREFFGGNALGRTVVDASGRRIDIVGVVTPEGETGDPPPPTLYFFERQTPGWTPDEVTPRRFRIPFAAGAQPTTAVDIPTTIVSAGYLDAMGGGVAGAGFAAVVREACGVALINREAAAAFFDGKGIGAAVVDPEGRRAQIIGIVESPVLRVLERRAEPMIYFPSEQVYSPALTLVARTTATTPELVASIDERLQGLDGAWRTPKVMTLEDRLVQTALGPERTATALVAACAALALALGVIGVYGVMADAVRARQREIALRMALGAPAPHIVYGVFRDGLRAAGSGPALGLAIAWLLLRLLLHADDGFAQPAPWIWAACPAVLLVMVLVASIVPARWALAVNPLAILRGS